MPPRLFPLSRMPGSDCPRSLPRSRCRKQQRQRLGHQSRLLRSLYFQRVLGFHDHLPAFSRLESGENHAQPHSRPGRDRSQKANLVDSVIQPGGGIGRNDADLHRERSHHRQRQIAMRDRTAEWTFTLRSFDVDMNPLMVAGARRKRIDAPLVDRDPIGHAELLSYSFPQSGEGEVAHLFSLVLLRSCSSGYMSPYRSRSSFLLILPTLVLGMLSTNSIFSGIPYFEMMPLSANTLR